MSDVLLVLPGAAPSHRGRVPPAFAQGSAAGVSNGRPAVKFTPLELLNLLHAVLGHVSLERVLEHLSYHYPHLRSLVTKTDCDDYSKTPCPVCARYLVKSSHTQMVSRHVSRSKGLLYLNCAPLVGFLPIGEYSGRS